MAETAFIEALSDYLSGLATLAPAPATVGPALPAGSGDLPAIVLSLVSVQRLKFGLGGGVSTVNGVLAVHAEIDLADPLLAGTDFNLLSPDRLILSLPHGALVRADGVDGALGSDDLAITVAGTPRPLVAPPPAGDQVSANAVTGQLTFATALPASGIVAADYHLGAWDRRTTLISGEALVEVYASNAADGISLSEAAVRALQQAAVEDGAVPGLKRMSLTALGTLGPSDAALADARARAAHFSFEYEHIVDQPASSGGIIDATPITTHLTLVTSDPATGAIVEEQATESEPV